MADYKIALKLYQNQAGSENAKVKISINDITVGDNVEISNTDPLNPTLFVYDVSSLPSPAPGTTTTVKVELLNDFYVDSSNDRNIHWVGCGYAPQDADGNYYKGNKSANVVITDWTDLASFNWSAGSEYQGDENGTVDLIQGWHTFTITATYVTATISLTEVTVL